MSQLDELLEAYRQDAPPSLALRETARALYRRYGSADLRAPLEGETPEAWVKRFGYEADLDKILGIVRKHMPNAVIKLRFIEPWYDGPLDTGIYITFGAGLGVDKTLDIDNAILLEHIESCSDPEWSRVSDTFMLDPAL